jgi:hypothetical protein
MPLALIQMMQRKSFNCWLSRTMVQRRIMVDSLSLVWTADCRFIIRLATNENAGAMQVLLELYPEGIYAMNWGRCLCMWLARLVFPLFDRIRLLVEADPFTVLRRRIDGSTPYQLVGVDKDDITRLKCTCLTNKTWLYMPSRKHLRMSPRRSLAFQIWLWHECGALQSPIYGHQSKR